MFAHFGIKDAIDILLVAILLYYTYKVMKSSGTINIFTGILAFIGIWIMVTHIIDMRLMGAIMNKLISFGVLILVILFQDEIRRFLVEMGSHKNWKQVLNFFIPQKEKREERPYVMPIVQACMSMAKSKTGALIVIENNTSLNNFIETGDRIDAQVNTRLIENIFFKNSPLHDGALIVVNNRLAAAACILPVSHNNDIPKSLGLRHRSALGISQESDAMAIVVSEESGKISLAYHGKLHLRLSGKDLENMLSNK